MLRRHLKNYASLDYLHKLLAGKAGLPPADRNAAGIMSKEQALKLHHVEAGATADQTPEEILEALKQVHGEGSGLDADTMQGFGPDEFATVDHEHDNLYPRRADVAGALADKVSKDELLHTVHSVIEDGVNAVTLDGKSAEAFMLAGEFNAEAIAEIVEGKSFDLNAARVGGASLQQIMGALEPRNTALLKADEPRLYSAGERWAPSSAGEIGGGDKATFFPDPKKSNLQSYTNVGEHVFKAPVVTGNYEMKVLVDNGDKAGRVRFEGFRYVMWDTGQLGAEAYPEPGTRWLVVLTKIDTITVAEIKHLLNAG